MSNMGRRPTGSFSMSGNTWISASHCVIPPKTCYTPYCAVALPFGLSENHSVGLRKCPTTAMEGFPVVGSGGQAKPGIPSARNSCDLCTAIRREEMFAMLGGIYRFSFRLWAGSLLLLPINIAAAGVFPPYERTHPHPADIEFALTPLPAPNEKTANPPRLQVSALRCQSVRLRDFDPQGERNNLDAVARCRYLLQTAMEDAWGPQILQKNTFVYLRHGCGDVGQEADLWCFLWSLDKIQ